MLIAICDDEPRELEAIESVLATAAADLSAVIEIFPGNTKERFNGLLFQAVKPKILFIGFDAFININTFQSLKTVWERQGPAALLQEGDVKGIAVEVYQSTKVLCKGKKGVQYLCLTGFGIGKPLYHMKLSILRIDTSDEIEVCIVTGEAGGFDIEK